MIDFDWYVEQSRGGRASASELKIDSLNAGIAQDDPRLADALERIEEIAKRRDAEGRAARSAARKARPAPIDVMANLAQRAAMLDQPEFNGSTLAALEPVADMVPADEWDEWIAKFRDGEAALRKLRLRVDALRDGEALPECQHCGESFAGRSDARYCSTRCRVAAHRAKGAR